MPGGPPSLPASALAVAVCIHTLLPRLGIIRAHYVFGYIVFLDQEAIVLPRKCESLLKYDKVKTAALRPGLTVAVCLPPRDACRHL